MTQSRWCALGAGLALLLGSAGCSHSAAPSTGTLPAEAIAPTAGYQVAQVTEETRRYCRSRAQRCMRDANMMELYPSWSQRSEQCRQNYQDCINRNEGLFIRR